MITLRPPFRAENMEGLYNKVIKGQYSKIPEKFSNDLVELVRFLLQVQPENRPTPDQILKNPIIQKRMEFFKTYSEDMHHDNNLLNTIRIPKNLLFLTDRLPQANYGNKKNISKPTEKKKDVKESKDSNINNIKVKPQVKESKEEKKSLQQILIDNDDDKKNYKEEIYKKDGSPAKNVVNIKEKETLLNNERKEKQIYERDREKEKAREEKEKRHIQNLNKIYQINQPNYGSQEVLPSINRGNNNHNILM